MIIALEEARIELTNFRDQIRDLGTALRIEALKEQAETLEEQSQSADFWNNQEKSTAALQTLKQLKDKIQRYEDLCAKERILLTGIIISDTRITLRAGSICSTTPSTVWYFPLL